MSIKLLIACNFLQIKSPFLYFYHYANTNRALLLAKAYLSLLTQYPNVNSYLLSEQSNPSNFLHLYFSTTSPFLIEILAIFDLLKLVHDILKNQEQYTAIHVADYLLQMLSPASYVHLAAL